MKIIITVLIALFIAGGAACAAPGIAAPSATSTVPAVTTAATAVPPVTAPPVQSTLPPGYDTYNDRGYLRTWYLSPLWVDPGVLSAGRPVNVGANIYIDDIPLSYIHAELSVNGVVVDVTKLAFWFDDPLSFSLSFTPDKPGVYEVFIRANMLENEDYVKSTGEDLSLYSTMTLAVGA